jgi:hypothetical protein
MNLSVDIVDKRKLHCGPVVFKFVKRLIIDEINIMDLFGGLIYRFKYRLMNTDPAPYYNEKASNTVFQCGLI